MSDYFDPGNEELLKDFFVEAYAQVDALEQNILVLEQDSANADAIDEIFRAAHTLKGASATVQMDELTEFTHLVEDVFDALRSKSAAVAGDMVDTLLQCIDVIKEMLAARSEGAVYSGDVEPLKASLRGFLESGDPESVSGYAETGSFGSADGSTEGSTERVAARSGAGGQSGSGSTAAGELSEYDVLELHEAAESGQTVCEVKVWFNEDNPMNTVGGIQIFAALKDLGNVLRTEPDFESLYEDVFHPEVTYWIATSVDEDSIKEKAFISDVTTDIRVTRIPAPATGERRTAAGRSDDQKPQTSTEAQDTSTEQEAGSAVSQGNEDTVSRTDGAKTTDETVSTEKPHTGKRKSTDDTDEGASEATGARQGASDRTAAGQTDPDTDTSSSGSASGKKKGDAGSILRVDSRRIDNLLNLVSETVIIKAGFNKLSDEFAENIQHLENVESEYHERLKELFDSLPDYLEKLQDGASTKEVRRSINEQFGDLYDVFSRFEGDLKATSQKFRSGSQNLGRVTGELQEGVMRIRMVPISQIFSRFPRLVRDLSKSLKKDVNLKIEGEETELDKSVIEDLLDPLIHCARNSIDHGIEPPEQRREAGKPETGTLTLKASNEGNMILIEVFDDGRGIDVNKVRQKAIDRGVIHPNKNLSDVEAFNLIFDPGFSTAGEVTNVSGRGVGLDVVQQQIKKLNGSVSVWSEAGLGTRFTIKIPLTLAIIQGLLVRVGKEMYAIPITSVIDSHRIKPSEIKFIDNYEVFNVRDDVVSLLRLSRLFGIPTEEKKDYHFVVVVGSADRKMGLVVDELIGEEDVVIKPLRDHYTNVPGIAGANITGDGTVSLIIDVSQLLDLGLEREREQRRRLDTPVSPRQKSTRTGRGV